MKYVKKPIVVDAFKFEDGETIPQWLFESILSGVVSVVAADPQKKMQKHLLIKTLEGNMVGLEGDYIIKGIKGELYPCKPDIFEASYDPYRMDFE